MFELLTVGDKGISSCARGEDSRIQLLPSQLQACCVHCVLTMGHKLFTVIVAKRCGLKGISVCDGAAIMHQCTFACNVRFFLVCFVSYYSLDSATFYIPL